MSRAHQCPTCHGRKRIQTDAGPEDCPTCDRSGVVFEPEEAASQSHDDALDLTYRPE